MDSERIASAAENQGGEARVALPVRQPPKRRTNKEEIAGTALASHTPDRIFDFRSCAPRAGDGDGIHENAGLRLRRSGVGRIGKL